MNTAAAPTQTAGRYDCSVIDCPNRTEGHYCLAHTATCSECGEEWTQGELDAGMCRCFINGGAL